MSVAHANWFWLVAGLAAYHEVPVLTVSQKVSQPPTKPKYGFFREYLSMAI